MKKVLTYGTFDVFHHGHYNILKNAKALGDYLIVGVTSDHYDKSRGKLNVQDSIMTRIENVKKTGFADQIIIEEYEGQKIDDIHKYKVDIFTVGSDWVGKFDYLNEFCKVTYLPRTQGISSTQIHQEKNSIINIGLIGTGRIASRFVVESKYVSGVDLYAVYNPDKNYAQTFAEKYEICKNTTSLDEFYSYVDAVYIASPHSTHYEYCISALKQGKHVLCEKPMVLNSTQAMELYSEAQKNGLVLIEAIKTAFCPGFIRLISLIKSGIIGEVKAIDANFTKLYSDKTTREFDKNQAGGSMTELGTYCLLPVIKLFGVEYNNARFVTLNDKEYGVDLFTKGDVIYPIGIGSFKVGIGVKTEGDLVITGTNGYAYVPAPWWKTEYFEIRHEDLNRTQKYFYKFEGDGLRYELNEFIHMIRRNEVSSHKLTSAESIAIACIIEQYLNRTDVLTIV